MMTQKERRAAQGGLRGRDRKKRRSLEVEVEKLGRTGRRHASRRSECDYDKGLEGSPPRMAAVEVGAESWVGIGFCEEQAPLDQFVGWPAGS